MCKNCKGTPEPQDDGFNQFRIYGIYYGYPVCCIDEFISDVKIIMAGGENPRTAEQQSLATNVTHGFIPCKAHMQEMAEKNLKPEDILCERMAPPEWN